EASSWLFYDFNGNKALYPIVRVDELIETVIQTSLWFYEKIAYNLYLMIPERGFYHVDEKIGYYVCPDPQVKCAGNGAYHFHYTRKERAEEIKEALRKITLDKFDDETLQAASEIIGLSLYYQNCSQHDVKLLKSHPYRYYFILGRLLTKKGLKNNSYLFNRTIEIAEDLKPQSNEKMLCSKCNSQCRYDAYYHYYCEKCEKYIGDDELCVDKEILALLDKLYIDAGQKKLVNSYREKIKEDKEKA
ncbi:MAG: hypothetical protein V1492_05030, partial [Candidatus Micrarchaeota archaeon]